jgi:TolA-binding protein
MNTLRLLIPSLVLSLSTVFVAILLSIISSGCGSGQQTEEDPLFSKAAVLQYRVDSLAAENRRLSQQLNVLASENRSLTAKTADLEMKLKEAMTQAPPPPPAIADMSQAYASALAQYRSRDFAGAMQKFEQLLAQGIREDLADNCHYWIGECLYGMGKYSEAIGHFETALNSARSEKRDDSQLMIANCQALLGNKGAARDSYNKVVTDYPASPYVAKAKEKLAKLGK